MTNVSFWNRVLLYNIEDWPWTLSCLPSTEIRSMCRSIQHLEYVVLSCLLQQFWAYLLDSSQLWNRSFWSIYTSFQILYFFLQSSNMTLGLYLSTLCSLCSVIQHIAPLIKEHSRIIWRTCKGTKSQTMLVPINLRVDRMNEQRTYFIDIAVSFAINCLHNISEFTDSILSMVSWGKMGRVVRQKKLSWEP